MGHGWEFFSTQFQKGRLGVIAKTAPVTRNDQLTPVNGLAKLSLRGGVVRDNEALRMVDGKIIIHGKIDLYFALCGQTVGVPTTSKPRPKIRIVAVPNDP